MWYQINKNKQKYLTSIQTGQRQSIETTNLEEPTTSTATVPLSQKKRKQQPHFFSTQHISHVIDWTLQFQFYRGGM